MKATAHVRNVPVFALVLCAAMALMTAPGPAGCASPAHDPLADGPVPLLELERSTQRVSMANFQLDLELQGALPRREEDDEPADLTLSLSHFEGRWHIGDGRSPRYNTARHRVEPGELRIDGERIEGQVHITIVPDEWVPGDGEERHLTVDLELEAGPRQVDPAVDEHISPTGMRFWTIRPRTPSEVKPITGRYSTTFDGRHARGRAQGNLSRPLRPNRWNSGDWSPADAGIAFQFDMGTKRRNWNHVRLAQLTFNSPRDLSAATGLRIEVATEQPRTDAAVSIWLGEQDGGWYYLRDAAVLADPVNTAVIRFDDFAEAEWVAPGNHMDADYTLDLTQISDIAIGVVNPLGVGEVDFTLRAIDLVREPGHQRPTEPAQLRVTGRTLSVNEHNMVPAGIFGGYAPDLEQQYRPGTQRYLYAGRDPRTPRQRHARFQRDQFEDTPAIYQRLLEPDDDDAAARYLADLLGERRDQLAGVSPARRDERQGRDRLAGELNRLLNHDEFDEARLVAALGDSAAGATGAQGAAGDTEVSLDGFDPDQASGADIIEHRRRLLQAAFAEHLAPLPEHGPTEAFYIDCLGERFEPAYMLRNPNWEQWFADFGRTFAQNAAASGEKVVFQFWNEPYLNWAERSRVNLRSRFYDVDSAAEDAPVRVRYGDGSLGPVIPHFTWRRGPDDQWQVYDTTAFSYWSGRGNGWIYDQMLGAVAPAIKKTNPEVTIIAGWGFRWHEDHWAPWDKLYKPTIDRHIEWIDALDEHHYQGDTTAMNGSYEVATAYALTEHGKWLYSANTETNDLVDVPARGPVDTPEAARRAHHYRRMVYNVRDLVYTVLQSPDKLLTRTVIHPGHTPEATDAAFGLLKNLRGRLIQTHSSDPNLWVVASVDGTDPKAMPPGFDGTQRLVVVVFNDHRFPRRFHLDIDAPTGTTFNPGRIKATSVDYETFAVSLNKQEGVEVEPRRAGFDLTLPERSAWKIALPLTGRIVEHDQVQRRQHFSADILQDVGRDAPFQTTIDLPEDELSRASQALLRLVVESVHEGEAQVEVNGTRLTLPRAITADNGNRILELPLNPKLLAPRTPVRFTVNEGNHAGYRVNMTSIVLVEES